MAHSEYDKITGQHRTKRVSMNTQALRALSNEIHKTMPWLQGIRDHEQYLELMELMDILVEDYEENQVLIDLLFPVLERYEEESEYFQEFNVHIDSLDTGIATLRVLIAQYRLTLSDLPEIGSKSLVSLILSGKRQLTAGNIKALSVRFGIPQHMFIWINNPWDIAKDFAVYCLVMTYVYML